MATIEKFEELEVWKASMELCAEVYKITNTELFCKRFWIKGSNKKGFDLYRQTFRKDMNVIVRNNFYIF